MHNWARPCTQNPEGHERETVSENPFKKTLRTYRKDLYNGYCIIVITQRKDVGNAS